MRLHTRAVLYEQNTCHKGNIAILYSCACSICGACMFQIRSHDLSTFMPQAVRKQRQPNDTQTSL